MKTNLGFRLLMFLAVMIPLAAKAEPPKSVIINTLPSTTTLRPQIITPNKLSPITKNLILIPPPLGCLWHASSAPQYTINTLCRAVSRCISTPAGTIRDVSEYYFNMCVESLAEGEARQLWDELGGPSEQENPHTTSQMRAAIAEGRYNINASAFCDCMTDISALTCDRISETLANNPYNYFGFEELIPENAECGGAISAR